MKLSPSIPPSLGASSATHYEVKTKSPGGTARLKRVEMVELAGNSLSHGGHGHTAPRRGMKTHTALAAATAGIILRFSPGTRYAEPSDSHGARGGHSRFAICDWSFAERKRSAGASTLNPTGVQEHLGLHGAEKLQRFPSL